MANLFDYLKWRGDLSFKQAPFNEVDNLILSNLCYVEFTDIVTDTKISIKEAIELFEKKENHQYRDEMDLDFIKVLMNCPRYNDLYLHHLKELHSENYEVQFGAMMIDLDRFHTYVSFRGTDNSVVGWKEDLNLSFSIVPSQKEAAKYLNDYAKYAKRKLLVGGHSKGGNLAMYASAFANKRVFNRIETIYNNDGPGFDFRVVDYKAIHKIKDKLVSFTPETSMIYSIMSQVSEPHVIKSDSYFIMQHNPYSWQIAVDKFERVDSVDKFSEVYHKTIINWLSNLSLKERTIAIEMFYDLICELNADDIRQILPSLIKKLPNVYKKYKNFSNEEEEVLLRTFKELISSLKESL